jgi:hypothetical protein
MHRMLFLPDMRLAGYPVNPKAEYLYRISGGISDKGQIPNIRPVIWPDMWRNNYIFGKISNKFIKNILHNYCLLQTLHKA